MESNKMKLMEWVHRILLSIGRQPEGTVIKEGGLPEDTPTQGDKPSPTSHFELMTLYRRKRQEYPVSKGYKVSLLANTNSMEPLLDDNSVCSSEDFNTTQGIRFKNSWALRTGDICIYEGDPKYWGYRIIDNIKQPVRIIHKIIAQRNYDGKKQFLFQGHNNKLPDPGWVDEERIVARMFDWANAQQPRKGD